MNNKLHHESVLLVEDDMINAIALISMLEDEAYETFHAADGESSVELIENGKRFDFVIMDVNLGPGISGIDAAKKIINICGIPVIFLTGRPKNEIDSLMDGAGDYGYISKPACTMDEIKFMLKIISRSGFNSYILKKIIVSSENTLTLRSD